MKGDPPKGKCSKNMKNCRRWRRRAANVSGEFIAKKGWLETHLWHAKRCKMIEYWGFKVAAHLNEKCLKSTYRASTKGVLLLDFSYWQPFWMDCNLSKLKEVYGQDQILDAVFEHENIQICPIKIFTETFEKPLLLLHPAAIQTGILEHESLKAFLTVFSATLTSASDFMCTFKLHGPKAEAVLSQFLNISEIKSFPSKFAISDPRTLEKESQIISCNFDEQFLNPSIIKTDNDLNNEKSELFLSSKLTNSNEKVFVAVTRKNSEFYVSCPRKWARIVWYHLIKIKPIKVAGIEQIDVIAFENEIPIFPRDFVSSPAYEIWSESEKSRLETIHNRKPPAKRPSFSKIDIESPFKPLFNLFSALCKVVLEIEGKGIITDFAEIYTPERILIGYATTTTKSSLKKGCSSAIGSISNEYYSDSLSTVLVRNFCSPEVFRTAKIKQIK